MKFLCEPETRLNEAGQIQFFKIRWTEAREFTEWLIENAGDNLFYFGPIVFGISLLPAITFQMPGIAIAAAVVMLASMSLGYVLWRRLPVMSGHERVLVFRRDGKMRAPLGLSAGRFPKDESRLPHYGINSIEARPMVLTGDAAKTRYTHGVIAFYTSGDLNQVAEHLTPDQAHLLAVVMMAGVKKLHDDLKSGPGQRARPTGKIPHDDLID